MKALNVVGTAFLLVLIMWGVFHIGYQHGVRDGQVGCPQPGQSTGGEY